MARFQNSTINDFDITIHHYNLKHVTDSCKKQPQERIIVYFFL